MLGLDKVLGLRDQLQHMGPTRARDIPRDPRRAQGSCTCTRPRAGVCAWPMFPGSRIQGAFVPLFSLQLQELGLTRPPWKWVGPGRDPGLGCDRRTVRRGPDRRPLVPGRTLLGGLCFAVGDTALGPGRPDECRSDLHHQLRVRWPRPTRPALLNAAVCFAHLRHQGRQFGQIRLWGTVGWVVSGWLFGYWLGKPACVPAATRTPELADAFRFASLLAFALSAYALTLPLTAPERRAQDRIRSAAALRWLGEPSFAAYWFCFLGTCVTLPFTTQIIPLQPQYLGKPRPRLSPTMTLEQSTEILSLALCPCSSCGWVSVAPCYSG